MTSAGARSENVLVTGSSGLIGSAVIRRLADRFRLVGFDRDGPPHPPPEAECVCVDLTSDDSVRAGLTRLHELDAGRARHLLGWEPKRSLSGMLPRMVEAPPDGPARLLSRKPAGSPGLDLRRGGRFAREGPKVNAWASRTLRRRLPPEAPVAFFGFLLNYPWEMLQAPFYAGMTEMRHWDAVRECSWATAGDAGLLVAAFWVAAGLAGTRGWIAQPRPRPILAFLATDLLATVALEWLATNVWHRWAYAPRMPTVPVLGTGLVPLLQWLVLPPLLIWVVRRHLHGAAALAAQFSSGDPV